MKPKPIEFITAPYGDFIISKESKERIEAGESFGRKCLLWENDKIFTAYLLEDDQKNLKKFLGVS